MVPGPVSHPWAWGRQSAACHPGRLAVGGPRRLCEACRAAWLAERRRPPAPDRVAELDALLRRVRRNEREVEGYEAMLRRPAGGAIPWGYREAAAEPDAETPACPHPERRARARGACSSCYERWRARRAGEEPLA